MNKKIVIIILVLVCMLSIIVIGIFGSAVVNRNSPVSVKDVTFKVDNGLYDSNGKLYIELVIDDANPKLAPLQLKWVIGPDNATNKQVTFATDSPMVATVNNQGLITFSENITSTKTVIIFITTNDGSKRAEIKLLINYQKKSSIGDLDPDKGQFS